MSTQLLIEFGGKLEYQVRATIGTVVVDNNHSN